MAKETVLISHVVFWLIAVTLALFQIGINTLKLGPKNQNSMFEPSRTSGWGTASPEAI